MLSYLYIYSQKCHQLSLGKVTNDWPLASNTWLCELKVRNYADAHLSAWNMYRVFGPVISFEPETSFRLDY